MASAPSGVATSPPLSRTRPANEVPVPPLPVDDSGPGGGPLLPSLRSTRTTIVAVTAMINASTPKAVSRPRASPDPAWRSRVRMIAWPGTAGTGSTMGTSGTSTCVSVGAVSPVFARSTRSATAGAAAAPAGAGAPTTDCGAGVAIHCGAEPGGSQPAGDGPDGREPNGPGPDGAGLGPGRTAGSPSGGRTPVPPAAGAGLPVSIGPEGQTPAGGRPKGGRPAGKGGPPACGRTGPGRGGGATRPATRGAAAMAAPRQTVYFGCASTATRMPSSAASSWRTSGIRLVPPTSSTVCNRAGSTPARRTTRPNTPTVPSTCGRISDSKSALVTSTWPAWPGSITGTIASVSEDSASLASTTEASSWAKAAATDRSPTSSAPSSTPAELATNR